MSVRDTIEGLALIAFGLVSILTAWSHARREVYTWGLKEQGLGEQSAVVARLLLGVVLILMGIAVIAGVAR